MYTSLYHSPQIPTLYHVMCKVYTGYHGRSEIEHGLCACTANNPGAKARELSLPTGTQTMLYLSLVLTSRLQNLNIWLIPVTVFSKNLHDCAPFFCTAGKARKQLLYRLILTQMLTFTSMIKQLDGKCCIYYTCFQKS